MALYVSLSRPEHGPADGLMAAILRVVHMDDEFDVDWDSLILERVPSNFDDIRIWKASVNVIV